MLETDSSAQHGRYLQINDINMYYEEYGNGEPLLLLHGGLGASSEWKPFIPALSERFRVFALDSRGHGKTNNPKGELNYQMMSDDVGAFIKSLGLQKPSILGNSDGAQIILEMGIRYAEVVHALVLCAGGYTRSSEAYRNAWHNLGIDGSGDVDFDQLRAAFGGSTLEVWRKRHAFVDNPDRWKRLLQQLAKMWLTPLKYSSEDFQKVRVPVLLMLGDRDQFFPVEENIEMYRMLPSAELVVLPNSDHGLPFTAVELCTQIVLAFFQRHREEKS
jgi:pimeloyl-ACP methyl ester carboxylesterase